MTDDEPELEGTEASTERDLPIAIVDHRTGLGRSIPQVFGEDAQAPDEGRPIGDEEAIAVEGREHPLVRVETVAVCRFKPSVDESKLRAQSGSPRHRRIDVEPQPFLAADSPDLGKGIDRVRRRRPDGRRHEEGDLTRRPIRRNPRCQCVRPHGELPVDIDQVKVLPPDPHDANGLLDRRMRLRRGVGDQGSIETRLVPLETRRPLARCEERAERRARGAVLDDPAAGARRLEGLREIEHVDEPVHEVRFQLRTRRARRPQHPLDSKPCREKLPEDRRVRGVRREEGVEVGRLPVGDAGEQDLLDISEHRAKGFASERRLGRKLTANLARLDL